MSEEKKLLGSKKKKKIEIQKNKLVEYAQEADQLNQDILSEEIYLTPNEEAFASAYVATKNACKAVLAAGLCKETDSQGAIYNKAHRMWKKIEVRKRVRQLQLPLLYEHQLTAEMAVNELAKIGFSDIMDFIRVKKVVSPRKKLVSYELEIEPEEIIKLKKLGMTSVIQEIRVLRGGVLRIKLYDKQPALNQITNILIGEKKRHLVEGEINHKHEHSFTDLVEILSLPNDSPEKQMFVDKVFPKQSKKKILASDVDFDKIENAQFEVVEEPKKKKKKRVRDRKKKKTIL
jgi:phage terminase small subunit